MNIEKGPASCKAADISGASVNGDTNLNSSVSVNKMDGEVSSESPSGRPIRKAAKQQLRLTKVSKESSLNNCQSSASDKSNVVKGEKLKNSEGRKEKSKTAEQVSGTDNRESLAAEKKVPCNDKLSFKGQKTGDGKVREGSEVQGNKSDEGDDKAKGKLSETVENQEAGLEKRVQDKDKEEAVDKSLKTNQTVKRKLEKADVAKDKKEEVEVTDDVEIIDVQVSCAKNSQAIKDKGSLSTVMVSTSAKAFPSVSSVSINSKLLETAVKTAVKNSRPFVGPSVGSAQTFVPGMPLMLQSGKPNAQGSGVMYVSKSSPFLGSSSSHLNYRAGITQPSQGSMRQTPLFPSFNRMPIHSNFPVSSQNQKPRMSAPSMLVNIPEKPTSSKGMIDMIRWEVESRINIKPLYVKPNPKAELGNTAKWLFDMGSDIVKEYVYHDLVRIQRLRKDEGNLSAKEKEDLLKLKEIHQELNEKVGHLKCKPNRSCKCGFRTELKGILYNHQQHAHCEAGGVFNCALCKYSTRQPSTFRTHMQTVHDRVGMIENRPSLYECSSCPYETNQPNRLEQHKVRCQRQFREAFNLHPSSVTGPEISLCLENVFYFIFTRPFMNSVAPKPPVPALSSPLSKERFSKPSTSVDNIQTSSASISRTSPSVSCLQIGPRSLQNSVAGVAPSHNLPGISSQIQSVTTEGLVTTSVTKNAQQPLQPNNLAFPKQQPVHKQPNSGFEVCEICGGYVKDRKALRIHFFYAHRIDMPSSVFERPQAPLYCATCFARFWTAQGLQKHIEVHKKDLVNSAQNGGNVAGKCITCGHRVPNILMHMRMVHNREMRHYLAAQMCIFCGNRFATRREVENHISRIHGVIVKASDMQSKGGAPNKTSSPALAKPSMPGTTPKSSTSSTPARKPSKSQCVLCNMSFERTVDLTRHCMRVHHTCMKCGLVVIDKESLARHTCLRSASGMRTCEICKEAGFHPAYHIKHLRDKHLKKCSVILRRIDCAVLETLKRPITISDSEDDESEPEDLPTKRPKLNSDSEAKDANMDDSSCEQEDKTSMASAEVQKPKIEKGKEESKLCKERECGQQVLDVEIRSELVEDTIGDKDHKGKEKTERNEAKELIMAKESETKPGEENSRKIDDGKEKTNGKEAKVLTATKENETSENLQNAQTLVPSDASNKKNSAVLSGVKQDSRSEVDEEMTEANKGAEKDGVDELKSRSDSSRLGLQRSKDSDQQCLSVSSDDQHSGQKLPADKTDQTLSGSKRRLEKPDSAESVPMRKSLRRNSSKGDDVAHTD